MLPLNYDVYVKGLETFCLTQETDFVLSALLGLRCLSEWSKKFAAWIVLYCRPYLSLPCSFCPSSSSTLLLSSMVLLSLSMVLLLLSMVLLLLSFVLLLSSKMLLLLSMVLLL